MIDYKTLLKELSNNDSPLFIEWKTDSETFFHITIMEPPVKQDNTRYKKNTEWLLSVIINNEEKLLPLTNSQMKKFIVFMNENNIQEGDTFGFRAFKKQNSEGIIKKSSPYLFEFKPLGKDNLVTKIEEGETNEQHNRERFQEAQSVESDAPFEDQQRELGGDSNNSKKILEAVEDSEDEPQQPQEKIKGFASKPRSEVQRIAKEKGIKWVIKAFNNKWDSADYQLKLRLAWAAWCFTTNVSTNKNLEENLKELEDELENGIYSLATLEPIQEDYS